MTDTFALYNQAESVFEALEKASNQNLPPEKHTALRQHVAVLLAEAFEMLKTASKTAQDVYEPMFILYRRMVEDPANRLKG